MLLHKWYQDDLSQWLHLFISIIRKMGAKIQAFFTSSLNYMDKKALQK